MPLHKQYLNSFPLLVKFLIEKGGRQSQTEKFKHGWISPKKTMFLIKKITKMNVKLTQHGN